MSRSLYARLHNKYGTRKSGKENRQRIEEYAQVVQGHANYFLKDSFITTKPGAEVIVVGAGFAGLSTAYHLTQMGFKVTVLEARDRVGGRVWSWHNFAKGQITEAGAELIGSNHQIWVKLAKEFGFGLNVLTQDDLYKAASLHEPTRIGKRDLTAEESEKLHDWMEPVFDKLAGMSELIVDPQSPWNSPGAHDLDGISLGKWLDDRVAEAGLIPEQAELLRAGLEANFSNNNAVPTSQQSLLANLALIGGGGGEDYWNMTEVFRCGNGNDALAKALREAIENGKENHVLTNQPVENIVVKEDDGVEVTTNNGVLYKADYVVLSVPPSAWQFIDFDAELKKACSTQMGTAIKYLSAVKDRFWIRQSLAPSGISNQLGMTWEGTDNQTIDNDQEAELTIFTGAEAAQQILTLSGEERIKFYEREIEDVYPGYLASKVEAKLVPWPEERWTKAGYSCPGVGDVCTKIKALNEVHKGRMFFAGEHTCLAFFGYMEGALKSGMVTAKRISEVSN